MLPGANGPVKRVNHVSRKVGWLPDAATAMNQVNVDSINSKRRLSFAYDGTTRIVEPQCYGIGTRGTELLRAHQKRRFSPRSSSDRLCTYAAKSVLAGA